MSNPQSSVRLTFTSEDFTSDGIHLSLDTERNREVYGEEKTTFAPGEAAYLKLISSFDNYELYTSAGSVSRVASNILYEHSENIIFRFEQKASLEQNPVGAVSWEWLGRSAETPFFNGKDVSIPEAEVAVLKCDYKVSGDRLRLVVSHGSMYGNSELDVVVVAVKGENKASSTVSYSTEEGGVPTPIELEVSDFCSGEVVDEVEVFLDGTSVGTTNINGKIYLGELLTGSTHQLKMTKTGYVDSDQDVLHNDEFTVPTSS